MAIPREYYKLVVVAVITNLLSEFALIGLLIGLLVPIFTNYIFLWIGLKIFNITTVSKRQILLYVTISAILGYAIAFTAIGLLGGILQNFYVQFLNTWLIYIALSYFLLRFLFKLTGSQLLKIFVYLIVVNFLFSFALNFQSFQQLIIQGPLTKQSTTSLKDKTIKEQQNIKSRDSQRKSDLYKTRVALEEYFTENRGYPVTDNKIEQINKENFESSILYQELVPNYLANPLFDPTGGSYIYKSNGQSFELTATLENPNDPDCQIEKSECIYKPLPLSSNK